MHHAAVAFLPVAYNGPLVVVLKQEHMTTSFFFFTSAIHHALYKTFSPVTILVCIPRYYAVVDL